MEHSDLCKMTLLCVDDDARTRKAVASIQPINFPNHHLIFADNGIDALEHIRNHNPDIFMVGLDMPLFDHTLVTKEIKRLGKQNESIALSTHDNLDVYDRYVKSGIKYHIQKPINMGKIIKQLDEIMVAVLVSRLESGKTVIDPA